MQNLTTGSVLQGGKYRIERVLGQGGFGITYLAEQVMLGRKVAIKEFFLQSVCDRDQATAQVSMGTATSREMVAKYKEKFLKEARNIASLNHPNIVQVLDVFEENNTAYYIMEYFPGGSLSELLKRQGCLSQAVASSYISQVASALSYLHGRRMNHLDVKPANIMLNARGEAVLIDFGLSKQYDAHGEETSATPVGISEGYAPIEQYNQGGVHEFSPETDVYALGATYYKLLTGVTPPKAASVFEDSLPLQPLRDRGVSEDVIQLIVQTMEPRRKARIGDVGCFLGGRPAIAADEQTVPLSFTAPQAPVSSTPQESEPSLPAEPAEGKKNRLWIVAGLAVALVVLSALGYIVLGHHNDDDGADNNGSMSIAGAQKAGNSNEIDGHEFVDLGLPSGTLWASCNVGATSLEEYGDYFAWGDTDDYSDDKVFDEESYKFNFGSNGSHSKYCFNSEHEKVDNKTKLEPVDDVANVKWGKSWKIPTVAQWEELLDSDNCTWTTTVVNEQEGVRITSVKNGNSIFLPAAGGKHPWSRDEAPGHSGRYWSCMLEKPTEYEGCSNAQIIVFYADEASFYSMSSSERFAGRSVRAVASSK